MPVSSNNASPMLVTNTSNPNNMVLGKLAPFLLLFFLFRRLTEIFELHSTSFYTLVRDWSQAFTWSRRPAAALGPYGVPNLLAQAHMTCAFYVSEFSIDPPPKRHVDLDFGMFVNLWHAFFFVCVQLQLNNFKQCSQLIAAAVGDTTEAYFSVFPCFSFVFGGCASVFAGFVQERFASSGFKFQTCKKEPGWVCGCFSQG